MKKALVGYTGFVGSNLNSSTLFDELYNSKNITDAFNTQPDLLIYSAVPAAMFIANSNPDEDFSLIINAIENIKRIGAKRVVLISSIAVYDITSNVDEEHTIDHNVLLPYGKNRLYLEKWVQKYCENSLVIRLPAIYGKNLRKNFIYDFINVIPVMLNETKFKELKEKSSLVEKYYKIACDGYFHCIDSCDKELYLFFKNNDFNATLFTDSRSSYQFYNLKNLWDDIVTALKNNIRLLNITTEPVNIGELYLYLTGEKFENRMSKQPFEYDIRTCFAEAFGGENGYFLSKEEVMRDLKVFIDMEISKKWD